MSWLSELLGGGGDKDRIRQQQLLALQQQQEEQARAAQAAKVKATQEAEAKRVAAEKAATAGKAKTNREAFLSSAGNYAGEKMKATGINDTYGIGDYYKNLLSSRVAGLDEGIDARTVLDPEALYNQAYSDVRAGARRKATGQVNTAVGSDYGRTQFGDTVDDAILDSILNTQRGSATEAVERAKSRGILNDAGFAAAQKALGEQGVTARTNLEDVGQGVLGRYRTALDTEAENLRNRAGNLELTDNFDIAGAIKGLGSRAEGFRGRMEGDIRSAAGGTDYFDISSLLGKSATGQGFVNPGGVSPIVAAFGNKPKDENDPNKRRLVASTGAF